jgi:hypothetical protein
MIRRLQDEQARIQDQVISSRESSDMSFLYVRQDMTDVQNRINSLEKQVEELRERLTDLAGRPMPVVQPVRRPVHCRLCGESGHLANNSRFHPLMMPVVRASGPAPAQNPVIVSRANIQR